VDKLFKPLSKSGQKQVHFTNNDRREKNVTAEVFFKESEGLFQSVFGSDRKYWSTEMKEALHLGDSGGFPFQLAPLGSKVSLPIPAVPFDGKAPSFKNIFNDAIQVYVTPDQYFRQNSEKYSKNQTQAHFWNRNARQWHADCEQYGRCPAGNRAESQRLRQHEMPCIRDR